MRRKDRDHWSYRQAFQNWLVFIITILALLLIAYNVAHSFSNPFSQLADILP